MFYHKDNYGRNNIYLSMIFKGKNNIVIILINIPINILTLILLLVKSTILLYSIQYEIGVDGLVLCMGVALFCGT
jgi:hypothetical protein